MLQESRPETQPARREPPLAYPDFRTLWLATLLSGVGFRGQFVVLGWLLLESSDSPLIVGLGIGMLMGPNALFGVLGGAIVDREDRRRVLRLLSAAMGLHFLLLGALVLQDAGLVVILLLTFVSGSLWSVLQTARQSYAYDIVGAERAVSGLSLTNLAQRAGGIAGGIGAGVLISLWGPGEAYMALSGPFFLAALVMLLARTRGQAAPTERQAVWRNVGDYLVELKRNRTLATLILLTAAVEVLGFSHLSALPVLVRDELGKGGGTLGVMAAFSSAGGIAGILLFSLKGDQTKRGLSFLGVLCLFGLALVLLGFSQNVTMAIVAITIVSGLAALSDVLSQSLVQLSVPNAMRGRAMGSWALAIGMAPFGHVQMGALASAIGVSTALAGNGLGLLLLALAAGFGISRLRQL